MEPPAMCFAELRKPWQMVANVMLHSWRNGSFPIGAVIFDENWDVVARGQNSIHSCAESQPISCHELAHAEVNAMWQVSKFRHENIESYSLLTSLEPCMQCFGTFVMSRIGNLEFGASDEFAGATAARDANGYTEGRSKKVEGPKGEFEGIQLAFLTEFIVRKLPRDIPRILPSWRRTSSAAVKVGVELAHDGSFFKSASSLDDEIVWDQVHERLVHAKRSRLR
jgi:tRNA(adenine34) deaminase